MVVTETRPRCPLEDHERAPDRRIGSSPQSAAAQEGRGAADIRGRWNFDPAPAPCCVAPSPRPHSARSSCPPWRTRSAKAPVITKVTPKTAAVGTKLTIQGKNFKRGKAKNSVLFRRDKGKALFVKADVSTTKQLIVVVPEDAREVHERRGRPTRSPRASACACSPPSSARPSPPTKLSPVIGPEKANGTGDNSGGAGVPTAPDGDCDSDGVKNGADLDDDNDLLSDALELSLLLDPCAGDTDGDGVEDGFEYQSAIDLNNDDYQHPNYSLPYPGKTPYPNPLFKDADKDYDGDGLTSTRSTSSGSTRTTVNHTAARTLSPLSYSDGAQYSLSVLAGGNGRRTPTMAVARYQPPQAFRTWADGSGYGTGVPSTALTCDARPRTTWTANDVVTTSPPAVSDRARARPTGTSTHRRQHVSDDERDEDADGLTNYDEVARPDDRRLVERRATRTRASTRSRTPAPRPTTPTPTATASWTAPTTRTSTTSRTSWSSAATWPAPRRSPAGCGSDGALRRHDPDETYVNPFNPCLPDQLVAHVPASPDDGRRLRAVHRPLAARRSATSEARAVLSRGPARVRALVVLGRRASRARA